MSGSIEMRGEVVARNRLLTPMQLSDLLSDPSVRVIDVCTPEQFEQRHITGRSPAQVVNSPLFWTRLLLQCDGGFQSFQRDVTVELQRLGIEPESTLVFTEQSHAEGLGQSLRGALIAELIGWPRERIAVLNGGDARWEQEGLPVNGGTVDSQASVASLELSGSSSVLADWQDVMRICRGEEPGVLLDCRSFEEFVGEMPAPGGQDPELMPGRIPGSINVTWDECFTAQPTGDQIDGMLPSVFCNFSELRALAASWQVQVETPIVVFCYKGARASVVLKALRDLLGFRNVRIYFAGWAEWARRAVLGEVPYESCELLPSATRTFGHNQIFVRLWHKRRDLAKPQPEVGGYEEVDEAEIAELSERHRWFVEPLVRASDHVRHTPFFQWLAALSSPEEFRPAAMELWHHSTTFPQVMGAMLAATPLRRHKLFQHYAQHLIEEVDHHNMLSRWMLKQGLIGSDEELIAHIPTPETNACVNLGHKLVREGDPEAWMCALNSAIERLSNDFFKVCAERMAELGVPDAYFSVHVGADEFHSIMGLRHVKQYRADSPEGHRLILWALEGVKTWCDMLHSWIGHPYRVQFDSAGNAVTKVPLRSRSVIWTQ